ncbi:MAG: DUF1365 domain-containing protein [Hyphomicrobium sp.]
MALKSKKFLFNKWQKQLQSDPIPRGLLEARITHARFSPKPYVLSHKLTYLSVPLDELERLRRRFLNRNGWGLFALNDKDYGDGSRHLESWIVSAFETVGAQKPAGKITLVTLPRVLGFGFNPVSFWLCYNENNFLSAVLAEVNNTFGERHCYLCRKEDGSPIHDNDEITAQKVFHVSPFMPLDGEYRFRFVEKAERLAIRVDLYRNDRRALSATISGKLVTLTSKALAKSFLQHPFPTLQVIFLIHFHAVRLYMKGLKYFSKPRAPETLITSSLTGSSAVLNSEPP